MARLGKFVSFHTTRRWIFTKNTDRIHSTREEVKSASFKLTFQFAAQMSRESNEDNWAELSRSPESSSATWYFRCKAADSGAGKRDIYIHTYICIHVSPAQSLSCRASRSYNPWSLLFESSDRIWRISLRAKIKSMMDRDLRICAKRQITIKKLNNI